LSISRSRENVDSGFEDGLAVVVIEDAAGNFFELLVADDFGILRSDFVAHRICIGLEWFDVIVVTVEMIVSLLPERSSWVQRSPARVRRELFLPASRNPPAIFSSSASLSSPVSKGSCIGRTMNILSSLS
jgi:hypothetical protein